MLFAVPNISCHHCKMRIENALSGIKGVEYIDVNVVNKTVDVSGSFSVDSVKKALQDAGYPVKD